MADKELTKKGDQWEEVPMTTIEGSIGGNLVCERGPKGEAVWKINPKIDLSGTIITALRHPETGALT